MHGNKQKKHIDKNQYSEKYKTSQSLACPHCDEMFDSSAMLKKHIGEQHPYWFESLAKITLDMSTNDEK